MLTEKEPIRKRNETEKESEIQKGDPAAQSAEKLSEPQGVASFSGATSSNSAAPSTASVGLLLTPGAASLIEKEKEIHRQDLTEVEEEPGMEWFTRSAWVEFALRAERDADSAWVMTPVKWTTLWREQRLALLQDTWDSSQNSGSSRCNENGARETLLHTEAWQLTQALSQRYHAYRLRPQERGDIWQFHDDDGT